MIWVMALAYAGAGALYALGWPSWVFPCAIGSLLAFCVVVGRLTRVSQASRRIELP